MQCLVEVLLGLTLGSIAVVPMVADATGSWTFAAFVARDFGEAGRGTLRGTVCGDFERG